MRFKALQSSHQYKAPWGTTGEPAATCYLVLSSGLACDTVASAAIAGRTPRSGKFDPATKYDQATSELVPTLKLRASFLRRN